MEIDFKSIEIENLDGSKESLDISKELGNAIFRKTQDLGELELAREIYRKGKVDLTTEQAQAVRNYVEDTFLAFVKETVLPKLDDIINPKTEN